MEATSGWAKGHSCVYRAGSFGKTCQNPSRYTAFDPSLTLLGIYRTSDLAIKMFITVLFVIVKLETTYYPTIRDWLNELGYIHCIVY